jgi:hypothetical protein
MSLRDSIITVSNLQLYRCAYHMIGEILKVDKCCEVRHDFMLAGLLQLMILTHNSTIIGVEVLIPILLGFSEHSTSTVI